MSRHTRSAIIATFFLLILIGMPAQVSSFGGDGNLTFQEFASGGTIGQCQDTNDDNNNNQPTINGERGDDIGCVLPLQNDIDNEVVDKTEGSVWDTDLSSTMGDLSSDVNPSLMHFGELYRGSWGYETLSSNLDEYSELDIIRDETDGSNWVEENNLDDSETESGQWAHSSDLSATRFEPDSGNVPADAYVTSNGDNSISDREDDAQGSPADNRIIFPPTNADGNNDYGDGLQNEGYSGEEGEGYNNKGDVAETEETLSGDSSFKQSVRSDYGRIWEKHHIKSPQGDPDPTSCGSCGGSAGSDNVGYYANGDDVVKNTETCSSNFGCDTCGPSNDPCKTSYSNKETTDSHDCTQYDNLDGGRDSAGDFDDTSDWNDKSATYTEFTAYEDSGWGNAWCGYEHTVTVNVDGPRGQGNGFIVVENRNSDDDQTDNEDEYQIVGKEDHGGGEFEDVALVSINSGSGSSNSKNRKSYDLTNEIDSSDISCPNNKETCLMYVDFYTKDSGWSADTSSSGWKDAIGYEIQKKYTPEDSYSVCKNINRINSDIDPEDANTDSKDIDQLVNCDYIRDNEPVTALENSCGNKPGERMVAVEGPQVDADSWDEFLAYQQECVEYDTNPDDFSRDQSPDADASTYPERKSDANTAELDNEWIKSVQLGGIAKESNKDISDGYSDFTQTWTSVRTGEFYDMEVTLGTDAGDDMHVKAWFDWDQDGDFSGGGDQAVDLGSCDFNDCSITKNIETQVTDDNLGQTMMRVAMTNESDPDVSGNSWNGGEVEDYTIYVRDWDEPVLRKGACVLDGKVYPEGSVADVGNDKYGEFNDFEKTDSPDKEVCLDIEPDREWQLSADEELPNDIEDNDDNDNGGEWWDIDSQKATHYLRNNVVDSREYIEYWENNPDQNANASTGVTNYHKSPGFALEDDCYLYGDTGDTITCEDLSNTEITWNSTINDGGVNGFGNTPVYAQFFEGAEGDDDFGIVHNRVQSGANTGHSITEGTETKKSVNYKYQWEDGSFDDTEATDPSFHDYDNSYLNSTESRGFADVNEQMMGVDVFGTYTSDVIEKTPEKNFEYMNVTHDFSGGDHPMKVWVSETSDMSTNVVTREVWLNSSEDKQNINLGTSEDHQYLQFKIGIGPAPNTPQVIFGADETYSMSGAHNEVAAEIQDFYDELGDDAEGSVLGSGCGDRGGSGDCNVGNNEEPRDVVSNEGFTSDISKLNSGANRLEERTYFEGPHSTIAEMADMRSLSEVGDRSDSSYYDDERYGWRSTASKAIIWVQSGTAGYGSCPSSDLQNYLVSQDISFYSFTRGASDCRSTYNTMADDTGGETYDMASNNANIDFGPALSGVTEQLRVLPKNPSVKSVEITATSPPDVSTPNTQDKEPEILDTPGHPQELGPLNNSNIDEEDDEWSYTPSLDWAVANNGSAWPPGKCYGSPREQGVDKWKNESVYANSFVRGTRNVYEGGLDEDAPASPETDGDWINPDRDTLSVTEGGVSCDLTGHDWGYAVENYTVSGIQAHDGSNEDRTGDPTSPGTENVDDILPVSLTIESSKFAWDMDHQHPRDPKTNLTQWKKACGDDRNEYLIREHAAKYGGEYNPTFSGRSDYYACADRPTDCVLDNKVYSEGMVADVSDVSNNEYGDQSTDQEICLDINDELPGGEWWDVDNERIRSHIIDYNGTRSGSAYDPYLYTRNKTINWTAPGNITWHNGSKNGANEVNVTPYNPIGQITEYGSYDSGYALEDDCDEDLTVQGCDDTGGLDNRGQPNDTRRSLPGLVYSPFNITQDNQTVKSDDYSTEDTYPVRMWVNGSWEHGSDTGQWQENTEGVNFNSSKWGPEKHYEWTHTGGWPTENLNDSKIDPEEDTWAIADEPYDAVGPTGDVYDVGSCYGESPPKHSEGWVTKNETIMANSYVNRTNVSKNPTDDGVWVNPDKTPKSITNGTLSCDLNSTDWGIGYDKGPSASLTTINGSPREYGYNVTDRHAVLGPITFDNESDPLGGNQNNLKQYPRACGDDRNEYLIREQYSSYNGGEIRPNLTHRDNIYVCADRITDCAYNGNVYSEGQTTDISSRSPSHTNPERGDNNTDEEICLDLNKTTPGGEWYDKDQNLTVENRIKGLEDTYNISEPLIGDFYSFDVEGKVVDNTGGEVSLSGQTAQVNNQNGSFEITNVRANRSKMQLLKYYNSTSSPRKLLAQKRVVFPESGLQLENVKVSVNLMYNGTQVWEGVENFSDNDFDRNPYSPTLNGTDWRNQSYKYGRREVSYFNGTHENQSKPDLKENIRGNNVRYYTPEGYATEDDCGPLLEKSSTGPCADVGPGEQNTEWFSAGNSSMNGVLP